MTAFVPALQLCIYRVWADEPSWASALPSEYQRPTRRELEDASRIVFGVTHEVLHGSEGHVLTHWKLDVWRAQMYAKFAAWTIATVPAIKRLQREAAGDCSPLTICFGKETRRVNVFDQQEKRARSWHTRYSHGDGCGVVQQDSKSKLFKLYCDTCNQTASNRQRAVNAQKQALFDGLTWLEVDGEVVWTGECVFCGAAFRNARPDNRRCDRCRGRAARPQHSLLRPA